MPERLMRTALLTAVASLTFSASALAETRTVDDDKAQCPGAQYSKIQDAIDAAAPGDVVAVCAGTYVEGTGAVGTNALTITNKNIAIKGAGADLVAIQPKRTTPTGGRIADTALAIRNGVGDIISVIGTRAQPATVDISGVTVDGNGVYVEAGVVYRDAGGTLARSRVTNIVTSESNTADTLAGGYRSAFPGIGVVQTTTGTATPAAVRPALNITQTRIARYNRIGVLIDSATTDTPPLTQASGGVVNTGVLTGNQIVGRTQCTAFNTPTPAPYVLGGPDATPALNLPGNCSTVSPTTVGTLFGQDGVRVTAGSAVTITDNTISANVVHGVGAPTQGQTANNANLNLGAGIRAIGAGPSSVTRSNLTDNAYGLYNVTLDGATPNTTNVFSAENNFWGLRTNATANNGPAVSPTTNPPYQESAVNGTPTVDATCLSSAGAIGGSSAVDFCPFRNGNQADPNTGELPVAYAPLPISDAGPTVSLTTDKATYDRGQSVTLTAAAGDDFGIAKVTFYDGSTPIATAVPPAAGASFTIPADAACAARTFTAVAEDSTGQTASSSALVSVVGPNNCQPVVTPPTPPTDGGTSTPVPPKPTVTIPDAPKLIPAAGLTVSANAVAGAGASISSVVFKLGTRTVCVATKAPFTCAIKPNGGDVGLQSLIAIVTDSAGQTTTSVTPVLIPKFKSKLSTGITLTKAKTKFVRTVHGSVGLPVVVSKAQGCQTGTVTLTITENGTSLFPLVQVPLTKKCTYALRFSVPKTKKHEFKVSASFGGNSVLTTATNRRSFK